ncbi:F-box protein SKIP27-like [Diospyros lotus]|uniref:F-box protein SKIP27-like n=1 Tax=Diospyros lotus TaxID=55363 RepID=UPI00225A64A8|nr:F-box protein SKIP27-like [Diospyros lotus]
MPVLVISQELGLPSRSVRCRRPVSGKRIALSPVKKQPGGETARSSEKSLLEALPQDVLIRVLCGVDHDDLKQLFRVSKTIKEATLIAKQWHFAYSTPAKTSAFWNSIDLEDTGDIEAPNGPKQFRPRRSRLSGKSLASISLALFPSPDSELRPKKRGTGNADVFPYPINVR